MKYTWVMKAVVLSMLLPAFVYSDVAETDHEIHNALRRVRDQITVAFNKADIDAVLEHVHPEVVFTTMNGDTRRGHEAIREYFHAMMKGPERVVERVVVDFEPEALTVLYGGDAGVAYGSARDEYHLVGGGVLNVDALWTCSLVLHDGRWVVAAFHYSTNMFDNPVLDMTASSLKRFAVMCGVAGMVVGILVSKYVFKRA